MRREDIRDKTSALSQLEDFERLLEYVTKPENKNSELTIKTSNIIDRKISYSKTRERFAEFVKNEIEILEDYLELPKVGVRHE